MIYALTIEQVLTMWQRSRTRPKVHKLVWTLDPYMLPQTNICTRIWKKILNCHWSWLISPLTAGLKILYVRKSLYSKVHLYAFPDISLKNRFCKTTNRNSQLWQGSLSYLTYCRKSLSLRKTQCLYCKIKTKKSKGP